MQDKQRRARVLYVDDDDMVRASVAKRLAHVFDVDAVGDATAVEKAVNAHHYDAFVTDLEMPIDGWKMIERVAAIDPDLAKRAVILTAKVFSNEELAVFVARGHLIVTKGSRNERDELVRAIEGRARMAKPEGE